MRNDIEFGLLEVAPPMVEPISLDEAKGHLNIMHDDDDDLISRTIIAARRACERATLRSFVTTSWKYCMDRFPTCNGGRIVLPRPNLIAVSALSYLDTAGTRQTLGSSLYVASTAREPAVVIPAYGTTWPAAREFVESVQVSYTAGYGATADTVPADIKAAILLMIGHLYGNREAVVTGTIATELPMAVKALLSPYVVRWSQ
jgi:uncharacterized phiE125 gp8 family phage protein